MPARIEDYAIISDCHSAALVSRAGSIDWLCFPRFDSQACFAGLLGSEKHGRWSLCPSVDIKSLRRRYRGETLVLETDYGGQSLDAALLMLPKTGFLPVNDPCILGTIDAIRDELEEGGLIKRFAFDDAGDGPAHHEGPMPLCTCWMADVLLMLGRRNEAMQYFQRVLDIRNDVGLLSEEYLPDDKRLVGNMPQAYSHAALAITAAKLQAGDRDAGHSATTQDK